MSVANKRTQETVIWTSKTRIKDWQNVLQRVAAIVKFLAELVGAVRLSSGVINIFCL